MRSIKIINAKTGKIRYRYRKRVGKRKLSIVTKKIPKCGYDAVVMTQ